MLVPAGHTLDANTFALWRFDEASVPAAYTTIAAAVGNNLTTQGTFVPSICNKGAGLHYARLWNGVDQGANYSDTTAALATNFKGSGTAYTVEAWVYCHSFSTTLFNHFFSYAGNPSSELEAENYLTSFMTDTTSGKLRAFWETGAGTNVTVTQVAGTGVSLNTWTHVAMVVTISGVTATVKFYVGGVLQDTLTGTAATGGTSANMQINVGHDRDALYYFDGRQADTIVYKYARSDAEIAADAALTSTMDHTADGNTLEHWTFDDLPLAVDLSDTGLHLTGTPTSTLIADPLIFPADNSGHSKYFDGTTAYLRHGWRSDIRSWVLGEWTMECWVRVQDGALGANRGIIACAAPVANETQAQNYAMNINLLSTKKGQEFHESGAGTDRISLMTADWVADTERGVRLHLAVVKAINGGNYEYRWYKNGALVETTAAVANADGWTNQQLCELSVGSNRNNINWFGQMDDLVLRTNARSTAQILADYQAGATVFDVPVMGSTVLDDIGLTATATQDTQTASLSVTLDDVGLVAFASMPVAVDETGPTIENMTPAPGALPSRTTPIEFDVYDESGMRAVLVTCEYADGNPPIVVFDGTSFKGAFASLSTVTGTGVEGDPYHFTVRPLGGWPAAFELFAYLFDQKGNMEGDLPS